MAATLCGRTSARGVHDRVTTDARVHPRAIRETPACRSACAMILARMCGCACSEQLRPAVRSYADSDSKMSCESRIHVHLHAVGELLGAMCAGRGFGYRKLTGLCVHMRADTTYCTTAM